MDANTHMQKHEQEWKQTQTCTHMKWNGREHTLASMEANTHMHTHRKEWKRTHTGTNMNKNGSEHKLAHT